MFENRPLYLSLLEYPNQFTLGREPDVVPKRFLQELDWVKSLDDFGDDFGHSLFVIRLPKFRTFADLGYEGKDFGT